MADSTGATFITSSILFRMRRGSLMVSSVVTAVAAGAGVGSAVDRSYHIHYAWTIKYGLGAYIWTVCIKYGPCALNMDRVH